MRLFQSPLLLLGLSRRATGIAACAAAYALLMAFGHALPAVFVALVALALFLPVSPFHKPAGVSGFGNYRLERVLGRGGMGEVWRAQHRLLRRRAAVKLLAPDLLARAGTTQVDVVRRRFEREAQAIASLRSPHTVALYDFGLSDQGAPYYAMELLEGMDLASLVRTYGPQPAARVIYLLRQACDSLEEAHDLGMVHRDLKPTNLFLCRMGKRVDFLKVLDFGLVKTLLHSTQPPLTMHGSLSGTPAFMAPEQVRGEALDARADVYGLGCVAYFLLTGELVFSNSTPLAAAVAHAHQTPLPPSRRTELPIPPSLEQVVMACLDKDPANRPYNASELSRLLDACGDVPSWTQQDAQNWWKLHRPAPSGATVA